MRILLPIDDSPGSEEAITLLIDQMKPFGAEVYLMHVLDPFPERKAKEIRSDGMPDFVSARLMQREFARELLERAAKKLRGAGFLVSHSMQEGEVIATILSETKVWRADLIVMGSHPRKGIKGFFSRSVSEDVSREAVCSVEVVRIPAWSRLFIGKDPEVLSAAKYA